MKSKSSGAVRSPSRADLAQVGGDGRQDVLLAFLYHPAQGLQLLQPEPQGSGPAGLEGVANPLDVVLHGFPPAKKTGDVGGRCRSRCVMDASAGGRRCPLPLALGAVSPARSTHSLVTPQSSAAPTPWGPPWWGCGGRGLLTRRAREWFWGRPGRVGQKWLGVTRSVRGWAGSAHPLDGRSTQAWTAPPASDWWWLGEGGVTKMGGVLCRRAAAVHHQCFLKLSSFVFRNPAPSG